MNYQEIQPPEILSPYVKCFWVLESDFTGNQKERILPDGCMEFIFHYGNTFNRYNESHVEIQPQSFIYGQIKQFIEIGPTGKTGIIGVRFLPNGAQPFLKIPLTELTEKAIAIADLFGRKGVDLEEKIMTAKNNRLRIGLVQEFLMDCLKNRRHDHVIAECVSQMNDSKGQVTIESLSKEFNISARQLERKFSSAVGLSPKFFTRIIRFQNIFRLVQNKQINSLTMLSYESGYYDQAHFIKDFKEFSGINPRSFFNQEHDLTDLFLPGN